MTAPTPEHPIDWEALKRLRALADTTKVSAVGVTPSELDAILAVRAELEGLRSLAAFVEEEFEVASDRWGVEAGRRHLATDPEDGPSTGEEGSVVVDVETDEYLTWTPHKGGAEMLVERHNDLVEALDGMRAIVEETRPPAAREAEEVSGG